MVRIVRLSCPKVRKARRNFADPQEGVMCLCFMTLSTALLVVLRRRFKAVGDVLSAMIRDGITLARSLKLTVQWDGIIRIGPVRPLTVQDFDLARRGHGVR